MDFMVRYTRAVEKLTEFLGQISMYIVILTVFVGFSNVLLRYIGTAIGQRLVSNAFIETQWYLYSLIFMFGFAYILKNGINVRVDFWFTNQTPRTKAIIDLVGHCVALIPFCLLALYVTWNPVLRSWGYNFVDGSFDISQWEVSPDPSGLPRAPIKSMILVGFFTLLLQAIAEVFKLIAILRGESDKFDIIDVDAPIRIE